MAVKTRLRLCLLKLTPAKPGTWPVLSKPVDADETAVRIRAQSLLCGMHYRDGSSQCPPLTYSQALDVLLWANQRSTK